MVRGLPKMRSTVRAAAVLLFAAVLADARAEGDPPPAPASAPPSQPAEGDPASVRTLRERGFTVDPGGTLGRELRFWLVKNPRGQQAFLVTTGEGYLVNGKIYYPNGDLMMDTTGNPVLYFKEEDRRAHGLSALTGAPPTPENDLAWRARKDRDAVPDPDDSKTPSAGPAGVWSQLGRATAIEEGRAGAPLVYIFVDPYCPYCHKQWEALRQKVGAGALRVRWVPVAVLGSSQGNLGVAGGLLADPSPETLAAWMRERRVQPSESEAAKKALGLNMALFQALNVPSVPALIYKGKDGRLIRKVGVTDF